MKGTSKCEKCGKDFSWTRAKTQNPPKFCSKNCFGHQKIYECQNCNKQFKGSAARKDKKFCSRECHYDFGWVKFLCKTCGKESKRIKGSAGTKEFCSRECHYESKNIEYECKTCGKKFKKRKSRKGPNKFCSKKCQFNNKPSEKIILKRLMKSFEKYVVKKESCWEWNGSICKNGYGNLNSAQRYLGTHRAHRISYILHKGDIPEDKMVLHICHNRVCVAPHHLYLGNHEDNMRDRDEANRQAKGSKQGSAKLTEEQVLKIKKSNLTKSELSREYGVSSTQIGRIKNRTNWKHIET